MSCESCIAARQAETAAFIAAREISPMEKAVNVAIKCRFDFETEHSMWVTAEAENEHLKEKLSALKLRYDELHDQRCAETRAVDRLNFENAQLVERIEQLQASYEMLLS